MSEEESKLWVQAIQRARYDQYHKHYCWDFYGDWIASIHEVWPSVQTVYA